MRYLIFLLACLSLALLLFGCTSATVLTDGTTAFPSNNSNIKTKGTIFDDGTNSSINTVLNSKYSSYTANKSFGWSSGTNADYNRSSSSNNNDSFFTPVKKNTNISRSTPTYRTYKKYIPKKIVPKHVTIKNRPMFTYPVFNPVVLSNKNGGLNIKANLNTKIFPAAPGVVIFSGYREAFGNAIFIYNNNDFITIYYHLKNILVNKGQYIKNMDTVLGTAANYFHFEIRKKTENGIIVLNTENLLKKRGG